MRITRQRISAAFIGLALLSSMVSVPTLAKEPTKLQAVKPLTIAQDSGAINPGGPCIGVDGGPCSASTPVTTVSFPAEDITYSTNGYFNYKGRIFQGNDITVVDSAIGKQVTVKLGNGVDTITTFTLLLPNNLEQNGDKIRAVGITDNFVAPNRNNDSYTLLRGTVEISP